MSIAAHNWRKKVLADQPELKPETRIRRQIEGVERLLDLKYRARILDLGCGSGAQTLELARRKYRVLGMDISPLALAGARDFAKAEKLTVHFLSQDMRTLPYENEFNAVINIRNPIGCYPKESDDSACLEAAAGALKSGGKLLLDLLNREWLIRRLTSSAQGDKRGPSFDIKTGQLDCSAFRPRGGRPDSAARTMRLYSLTEVLRMLKAAGLTFRKVCGGYDARPYSVESLRMIVIAEKVRKAPGKMRVRDNYERALRIKGRPR